MITSDFVSPPSRDSFALFCRTLYQRRLVAGIGGNVSVRIKDKFLVTPSGVSLRDVTAEFVVVIGSDGSLEHGKNPSKEFDMHRLILAKREDVNVVCHVHGGYIVAASSILETGPDSFPPLTPGFTYLAYPLPLLPFYVPGSPELADAVGQYFSNRKLNALLIKNHGLITVGVNMADAINIAEEIDEAAQIYVLTAGRASTIDKESVSKIYSLPRSV
jgi:ribulose-5-phosphate 4-epimerase/fuculose-1-phosphate aldolase